MISVILLERVGRVGQIGQVVKVKPGYARNFLLPRKKALRATKENLAYFEAQRSVIEAANADARAKAEAGGKSLDGKIFTIIRQASEVGQLFGSVTVRDVADTLNAGGAKIERQQVMLPAPIKTLGIHTVKVSLHAEVSVSVRINIARTEDEAKIQEKTGQAVKLGSTRQEDAEAAAKKAAEQAAAMFEKPAATEGEAESAEGAAETAPAAEKPAKAKKAKAPKAEAETEEAKPE